LKSTYLHLSEDHGGDFFRAEDLVGIADLDLDVRLVALVNDSEWPQLDITLHRRVGVLTADKALSIEDCVLGVDRQLILGRVTCK
jgi:hypothetical protein